MTTTTKRRGDKGGEPKPTPTPAPGTTPEPVNADAKRIDFIRRHPRLNALKGRLPLARLAIGSEVLNRLDDEKLLSLLATHLKAYPRDVNQHVSQRLITSRYQWLHGLELHIDTSFDSGWTTVSFFLCPGVHDAAAGGDASLRSIVLPEPEIQIQFV